MSRIIRQPKKSILPFPGLWLPGMPLPGAMGFAPGYPCCCDECDCEHCTACPTEYEVVIEGLTSQNPVAYCPEAACLSFNDTFILPNTYELLDICSADCDFPNSSGFPTACRWQYIVPSEEDECASAYAVCGFDAIILAISATTLVVLIYGCLPTTWIRYEVTIDEDSDCTTFSDLDVPFDSQFTGIVGVRCLATSSTCTVTAQ